MKGSPLRHPRGLAPRLPPGPWPGARRAGTCRCVCGSLLHLHPKNLGVEMEERSDMSPAKRGTEQARNTCRVSTCASPRRSGRLAGRVTATSTIGKGEEEEEEEEGFAGGPPVLAAWR